MAALSIVQGWIASGSLAAAALIGASPEPGVRLELETDDPVAILRPDQTDSARLTIHNESGERVAGILRLGVRRTPRESVNYTRENRVEIAAHSDPFLPFPTELVDDLGMYYLDWEIRGSENNQTGVISLARMDPVGPTSEIAPVPPADNGFLFGIAGGIRIHHSGDFKRRFLRAAALIGTQAYRADMSWNGIQPEPEIWNWDGLDELVAIARDQGIRIQPLVAYGNDWAVSEEVRRRAAERDDLDHIWRYPPRLEPWAEFTRRLAERYGTRMQYYEIWNEPDISFFKGNAQEYLGLLQTAARQIRSVDPEIKVTTAGFTSMSHGELDRELQRLTLTEGRESFDAIAWHRHGDFGGFREEVDNELLPWLRELGHEKTPLVFNESAVARKFEREDELATQLVKKMTFTWSRGAIGHYWYNLMRSHPDFQMLNDDWTPRPSYPAYNQLARLLRGRRFSHELELGSNRWGFVFHGSGHFTGRGPDDWVVVAWTEDEARPPESFSLALASDAEARRVDLMGNRQKLTPSGETVTLTVDHQPGYLVIHGSSVKPDLVESD